MSTASSGAAPTAARRWRRPRAIAAAVVALAVAAGGVFAWSSLSDDGERLAKEDDPELCSLVRRSEVETALGAKVVDGPSRFRDTEGVRPLEFRGMSAFCRYRTADGVDVWFGTAKFSTDRFARAAFSEFVADPQKSSVEPIRLLGLDAVWTNPGGHLMVLRGDGAVFGMVINGPFPLFAYERERAKRLATAALDRL